MELRRLVRWGSALLPHRASFPPAHSAAYRSVVSHSGTGADTQPTANHFNERATTAFSTASEAASGFSTSRSSRPSHTHASQSHGSSQRASHPTNASSQPSSSSSSSSQPSSEKSVVSDSAAVWMRAQMQRAVEAGKQTAEAAAYFESLWTAHPDMGQCLNAARDIVGTNDPQQLTRYQQSLFTDRLSEVTSRVASQRMMKMQNEESAVRRHAQDGSPTGENYWTEAGASLIAPDVPTFVKDEVLRDMQRDRPADSPAFEEPGEGEFKPVDGGDVEGYAEHVRRMKKSLLSGSDWK